jgi:hypothetical protein
MYQLQISNCGFVSDVLQRCRFASHSLSLGHFFFARLSVQSPQIVMSGLHGTKPSEPCAFAALLAFALRAFSILDTFDMIQTSRRLKPAATFF